jgi:hypothetical protein
MTDSAAERYIRLGLRLGRHVEGLVDAYYGPPELAREVEAEELVDPGRIAADADELLADVGDGWLGDQVLGIRTCAAFMAGGAGSYADEVEGSYGVRPSRTDEAVYAAAHEELEELLPGDGSLLERYEAWRRSTIVPADRIEAIVAALIEEARAWTRELVRLPECECVDLEVVRDRSWLAFCEYVGGLRSQISVNSDLPMSAFQLLHIACHETYPGHHTERALKDELLVRGQGRLEETIVLVPTPQSLISEGIAELGSELLLEGDGGERLNAVLDRAGIELDLPHALAVTEALGPCRTVEVDAALMLHDQGAGDEETSAYIQRWSLMTEERAAHIIRFMRAPTTRTYVVNYSAGRNLCRAYVGDDLDRFRRLLTEQLRVADLR